MSRMIHQRDRGSSKVLFDSDRPQHCLAACRTQAPYNEEQWSPDTQPLQGDARPQCANEGLACRKQLEGLFDLAFGGATNALDVPAMSHRARLCTVPKS